MLKKRRFYIGFLGELAFEQFLKENAKKYKYEPKCDGESGNSDFYITAHRELSVDVKASPHPNAQNLLIPKNQYDWRNSDIYVAVKLKIPEKTAIIEGYCFKQNLLFDFPKATIPTYYLNYDALFPIENLLNKLV